MNNVETGQIHHKLDLNPKIEVKTNQKYSWKDMDERVIELIKESNNIADAYLYLPKDYQNTLIVEKTNLIDLPEDKRDFKMDYYYVRDIGSGSFGKVCEYKHKVTEVRRAVKILDLIKLKIYPNIEKQIITELRALKSLDHPNVMNLYGIYKNQSNLFIVTELFEGGTLDSKFNSNSKYPEFEHVGWISQLLKALAYCHTMRIAHRDLKPENIMFSGNTLKLIDFGLSGFMEAKQMLKSTVGSPIYMAPEILTKEFQYSEKCDLWSLGIIIIFIITGNFPYQAHDLHHLIEEVKGINFSREYFQKNPLYKNIS